MLRAICVRKVVCERGEIFEAESFEFSEDFMRTFLKILLEY
jgi:hypothetical protein